MVINGNVLQSHPMEAEVPQGYHVSPILFAIHTAGVAQWVEERVQGVEGLSLVDDPGWVAYRKDLNQMVKKHASCAVESIERSNKQDLQINSAKTKAAVFTCRTGHKMHHRPNLPAKIKVEDGLVQFN
jgi:hypothetical protein